MGNINENSIWHDKIYLIERNDPVSGGINGIANKATIQLTDRTVYLKEQINTGQEILERALVYTTDNPNYQANNKTIEHVSEPVNEHDVANRLYVDRGDAFIQDQLNSILEEKLWGWELVGDFENGCEITKRNQIVHDKVTNQYFNWIGNLPYVVLPKTNPIVDIADGNPWIIVDNTNEMQHSVEKANQKAQQALDIVKATHLPESLNGQAGKILAVNKTEDGYQFIASHSGFYGFRKKGAELIVEIGDGDYNSNDFNEWFISGIGASFSIDKNGNLLINL